MSNKKSIIRIVALVTAALILACMMLMFTGCGNRQVFDVTYTFDRAIIELPNGAIVEGEVESWRDYESDSIQVVIDGVAYYTHVENVVLIAE